MLTIELLESISGMLEIIMYTLIGASIVFLVLFLILLSKISDLEKNQSAMIEKLIDINQDQKPNAKELPQYPKENTNQHDTHFY